MAIGNSKISFQSDFYLCQQISVKNNYPYVHKIQAVHCQDQEHKASYYLREYDTPSLHSLTGIVWHSVQPGMLVQTLIGVVTFSLDIKFINIYNFIVITVIRIKSLASSSVEMFSRYKNLT